MYIPADVSRKLILAIIILPPWGGAYVFDM